MARWVRCDSCGAEALALVPADGDVVRNGEDADGAVRTTCRFCEARFSVPFRTTADDD